MRKCSTLAGSASPWIVLTTDDGGGGLHIVRLAGAGLLVSLNGGVEDLVDTFDVELIELLRELCLLVGVEFVPEGEEVGLTPSRTSA